MGRLHSKLVRSRWLAVLSICAVAISAGAAIWWITTPLRPIDLPVVTKVGTYLSTARNALKFYYEERRNESAENLNSDFSLYLSGIDSKYSIESLGPGDRGKDSMGIYLMLPKQLESDSPLLIAYTDSFKYHRTVFRHAMFLRDGNFVILPIPENILKGIVGTEAFDNKKPDLYFHL